MFNCWIPAEVTWQKYCDHVTQLKRLTSSIPSLLYDVFSLKIISSASLSSHSRMALVNIRTVTAQPRPYAQPKSQSFIPFRCNSSLYFTGNIMNAVTLTTTETEKQMFYLNSHTVSLNSFTWFPAFKRSSFLMLYMSIVYFSQDQKNDHSKSLKLQLRRLMTKPVYAICEQQRRISACAFVFAA